jgi:hypothetical protein
MLKSPPSQLITYFISGLICSILPAFLYSTNIFYERDDKDHKSTSFFNKPWHYIINAIVVSLILVNIYDNIAIHRRKTLCQTKNLSLDNNIELAIHTETAGIAIMSINTLFLLFFLFFSKYVLASFDNVSNNWNYIISTLSSASIAFVIGKVIAK